MTKLYENCQRMICIAYANEMADACHELQIDPYEVSRAAATKPFGYLPFTPSAGVGGHCIPVNPSYLFSTSDFPLLKHATEKMAARPAMLADRLMHSLASFHQDSSPSGHLPKKHKKILVVGVAFKTGQELTTNSAGVGMIHRLLEQWDVHVTYADPLVREEALPYVPRLDHQKQWNRESLGEFDAVAVVIRQLGLDFTVLEALDGVLVQSFCP
jgi:nucleotide sugar dehydrogenase